MWVFFFHRLLCLFFVGGVRLVEGVVVRTIFSMAEFWTRLTSDWLCVCEWDRGGGVGVVVWGWCMRERERRGGGGGQALPSDIAFK